ncbi:MAG: nucleotide exchange factor GrpE [Saprospiraceae bacterium]|nr:nucleotide exchange factor GrpE [Saprospiraceae bacterium]MBK9727278.1 nucleotide exchange factor GrpE [Saprospiraceae bacterium]
MMTEEQNSKINIEVPKNGGESQQSPIEVPSDSIATIELDTLKAELSEQKDKYLRLFAEFDNYKKRTIKERIELIRNASQELIQDLLFVLDDFDRAKKLSEDQNNAQIFPEGMKLVYHKLQNLLHSKGLEVMESDGKLFDPQFHEAITEFPTQDENMKGKVFDTLEKGYTLNHKIIRFAKVVVAK